MGRGSCLPTVPGHDAGTVAYVDPARATFELLVDGLMGRATQEADRAIGASFDQRVRSSLDLVLHGESLIALENLCDNLSDYEVRITTSEYGSLSFLATNWGLSKHRRALIDGLQMCK